MVQKPCLFKASYSRCWLFDDMGRPEKYRDFVMSDLSKIEQFLVGSWVGDLTQIGSCEMVLDWFIMHLRRRFSINEKATGTLSYMLSVRITRDRAKGLFYMDKTAAIVRLAGKCGLAVDLPQCKRVHSSMSVEVPPKHTEKTTDYEYLSIIGVALHICGLSRPNCAFAVSRLARYSATSGETHVEVSKRLVSYLHQTQYMTITHRADVENLYVPMIYTHR